MPELPEVEYVRRALRPAMEGARIESVLLRRADLRTPFGEDFAVRLQGQLVRRVARRAKYLLVELASGDTLVMHLGMSGWFRLIEPHNTGAGAAELEKHDHVVFAMSSGARVVFNDPRRFGFMRVVPARELPGDRALAALGPEPLAPAFTGDTLARALARRKTSLKAALSDQRTVAGLGNIYVCEALHVARLSPTRRAGSLATRTGAARPQTHALATAIRMVVKDAIAHQHRAGGADRFRVYDREGRRCPRRGCAGTIRRIVQAGRSTFYCPRCQR